MKFFLSNWQKVKLLKLVHILILLKYPNFQFLSEKNKNFNIYIFYYEEILLYIKKCDIYKKSKFNIIDKFINKR